MKKHIQLAIPTPCHEDWDKMNPVEKGRFCDSCQKKVIDFTQMSDREIALFFKKSSNGSTCGRFMQDQLDRNIEIPKKRIPWLKYFFQFALPAMFVSAKATAQGNVRVSNISKVTEKPTCSKLSGTVGFVVPKIEPYITGDTTSIQTKKTNRIMGKISVPFSEYSTLKGKVIDENGNPLPFATIQIKGTKTATVSDTAGNFSLTGIEKTQQLVLVASSVGFMPTEKPINLSTDSKTNIVMMQSVQTTGLIVVAGYTIRKKTKPELKNVSLIPLLKDTLSKIFKIFPNPVKTNSSLNIEWKQTESGKYLLQLLNQTGQLVYSKEIWIDDGARVLNVEIPSVTSGNYFLRMTNKKSGKSTTEKVIIE